MVRLYKLINESMGINHKKYVNFESIFKYLFAYNINLSGL